MIFPGYGSLHEKFTLCDITSGSFSTKKVRRPLTKYLHNNYLPFETRAQQRLPIAAQTLSKMFRDRFLLSSLLLKQLN